MTASVYSQSPPKESKCIIYYFAYYFPPTFMTLRLFLILSFHHLILFLLLPSLLFLLSPQPLSCWPPLLIFNFHWSVEQIEHQYENVGIVKFTMVLVIFNLVPIYIFFVLRKVFFWPRFPRRVNCACVYVWTLWVWWNGLLIEHNRFDIVTII